MSEACERIICTECGGRACEVTAPHEAAGTAADAGLLVAGLLVMAGCSSEQSGDGQGAAEATGDMILATTTSTQDSGLLDAILPTFEQNSDCVPKTVAVGSGQAMAMGESGDADVLWCTRRRPRRSSWPGATAPAGSRSCTTTSCWSVRPTTPPTSARPNSRGGDGAHRAATGAVRVPGRRLRHAREGAEPVGGGRHQAVGVLVHRDRTGDGRDIDHRQPEAGLHAQRPRHLPRDRQPAVQNRVPGITRPAESVPCDRRRPRRHHQRRLRRGVLAVDPVGGRCNRQSPSSVSRSTAAAVLPRRAELRSRADGRAHLRRPGAVGIRFGYGDAYRGGDRYRAGYRGSPSPDCRGGGRRPRSSTPGWRCRRWLSGSSSRCCSGAADPSAISA